MQLRIRETEHLRILRIRNTVKNYFIRRKKFYFQKFVVKEPANLKVYTKISLAGKWDVYYFTYVTNQLFWSNRKF